MDVAANSDWSRDGLNIGLFEQDGADMVAEELHLLFREMPTFHELCYPFVWIEFWHNHFCEVMIQTAV